LTLGITFISLTILAFANVLLKNAETSQERIGEVVEFERVYQLDSSVASSLTDFLLGVEKSVINLISRKGNFTLKTHFFNVAFENESFVKDFTKIFSNRTKYKSNAYFSEDLVKGSDVFLGDGSSPIETQKFHIEENKNMFMEFGNYPYNFIYFSHFDHTNIEAISITINGTFTDSNIQDFTSSGEGDVPISIYLGGNGHTDNYFGDFNYVENAFASFHAYRFFDVNLTMNSINYTFSIVGFNGSKVGIPEKYGLIISNCLSDSCINGVGFFKESYNMGRGINEILDVRVDATLTDNSLVGFTTPGIFNIDIPFLETRAVNKSLKYKI